MSTSILSCLKLTLADHSKLTMLKSKYSMLCSTPKLVLSAMFHQTLQSKYTMLCSYTSFILLLTCSVSSCFSYSFGQLGQALRSNVSFYLLRMNLKPKPTFPEDVKLETRHLCDFATSGNSCKHFAIEDAVEDFFCEVHHATKRVKTVPIMNCLVSDQNESK